MRYSMNFLTDYANRLEELNKIEQVEQQRIQDKKQKNALHNSIYSHSRAEQLKENRALRKIVKEMELEGLDTRGILKPVGRPISKYFTIKELTVPSKK